MAWNGVAELVWRLCQVDPAQGGLPFSLISDPAHPDYDPSQHHIIFTPFVDGLVDLLGGYHTTAQFKAFYNMNVAQEAEFDIFVAKITSAPQLERRLARVERFKSIMGKWETKEDLNLADYATPADIEVRILELDSGF